MFLSIQKTFYLKDGVGTFMDLEMKPAKAGSTDACGGPKFGKQSKSEPYYDFGNEPKDSFKRSSPQSSDLKNLTSGIEKKIKDNPDTHGIGNRDIESDNSELDSLLHEIEDIENQAMGKPRKARSAGTDNPATKSADNPLDT